jgi:hypothetical protein
MSSKGFRKFRKNSPDDAGDYDGYEKRKTPRKRYTKREDFYEKVSRQVDQGHETDDGLRIQRR